MYRERERHVHIIMYICIYIYIYICICTQARKHASVCACMQLTHRAALLRATCRQHALIRSAFKMNIWENKPSPWEL